jgi:hypothetical protein
MLAIRKRSGEILQCRCQKRAERHQEDQVKQCRRKRPPLPRPQSRQQRHFDKADQSKLPSLHDPEQIGRDPKSQQR